MAGKQSFTVHVKVHGRAVRKGINGTDLWLSGCKNLWSLGWHQHLQILLPVLLCGVTSMLLAWIIDRMMVDVIMGYRHFKKSMIE